MRILEKYRFRVLHISQFYPRPGTPAARMQRIPTQIVKERSRKATKFFNSYTSFDHLLGTTQNVLITEQSGDGVHYIGHDKQYHQVLIKKDPKLMGRKVKVEIVKVEKWHLEGTVISIEDTIGQVKPQRVPHLVRVNKQIVDLDVDETDDGIFVSGIKKQEISYDALLKNKGVQVGLVCGLIIPVLLMPIRNSIKFSFAAVGLLGYQYFFQ